MLVALPVPLRRGLRGLKGGKLRLQPRYGGVRLCQGRRDVLLHLVVGGIEGFYLGFLCLYAGQCLPEFLYLLRAVGLLPPYDAGVQAGRP